MKFLFSLILWIPFYSYCQCNIKYSEDGDYVYRQAKREAIYENKDLENGIKSVFINMYLVVNKSSNEVTTNISLFTGSSGSYNIPLARTLEITSTDDFQIRVESVRYTTDNVGATTCYTTYFVLTKQQAAFMLAKSIKYIKIIDNRTGISSDIYFQYSDILKEQMQCMLK